MIDKSKNIGIVDYLEIAILFLLPLPFLKLNILYIILVLVIIGFSKYLRKEKWSDFGFISVNRMHFFWATIIGLAFGVIDNYFLEPYLTKLLLGKKPDLSTLEDAKGNIRKTAILLIAGWIIGGFFEEFFFRGYLFFRISKIIKNEKLLKWTAIVVTSIVFAFAHAYQEFSAHFISLLSWGACIFILKKMCGT